MTTTQTNLDLATQKLAAFEQIQTEFESCFHFVQDVHGQKRFTVFPVKETVHYLHALWICECKDRLLSVNQRLLRYDGSCCLDLLQGWQTGTTSEVVAFLQRKLDGMPFADLASQIQQAQKEEQARSGLLPRLVHGLQVLLNRMINLTQAFDAIFALSEQDLLEEVQQACAQYGHRSEQIEQQRAEMETPLYACVPHQLLAQRNMLVMNKVGVRAMTLPDDLPENRSERVNVPREPEPAFAEYVFTEYHELTSPLHNNLKAHRFIDRPEHGEGMTI